MSKEELKNVTSSYLMLYPDIVIEKALDYMMKNNRSIYCNMDISNLRNNGKALSEAAKRVAHFCRLVKNNKI